MRFWLAAFVLLFSAVEFLQWAAGLGNWQPGGVGLILGGMGLAAVSNLGRWGNGARGNGGAEVQGQAQSQSVPGEKNGAGLAAATEVGQPVDQSDVDSISFKVRPLKR